MREQAMSILNDLVIISAAYQAAILVCGCIYLLTTAAVRRNKDVPGRPGRRLLNKPFDACRKCGAPIFEGDACYVAEPLECYCKNCRAAFFRRLTDPER